MNVDETDRFPHLAHEVVLIREALEKKMPVLGICLGAQLIAKALGARVTKNHVKEIGWYDLTLTEEGKKDPLFAHSGPVEKVFQWHGDTFEIPKGAVHLAACADCPNQAFKYGEQVYALQFHLEVDEKMIRRWLTVHDNKKELEEIKTIDPGKILEESPRHIERLNMLSRQTFGRFIDFFGPRRRFFSLFSR